MKGVLLTKTGCQVEFYSEGGAVTHLTPKSTTGYMEINATGGQKFDQKVTVQDL